MRKLNAGLSYIPDVPASALDPYVQSCKLGVDAFEVIRAAATKPFRFMPFYPGPGLGGHCIPIDPLYLSWKAFAIMLGLHERGARVSYMDPLVARLDAEGVSQTSVALDTDFGRSTRS